MRDTWESCVYAWERIVGIGLCSEAYVEWGVWQIDSSPKWSLLRSNDVSWCLERCKQPQCSKGVAMSIRRKTGWEWSHVKDFAMHNPFVSCSTLNFNVRYSYQRGKECTMCSVVRRCIAIFKYYSRWVHEVFPTLDHLPISSCIKVKSVSALSPFPNQM